MWLNPPFGKTLRADFLNNSARFDAAAGLYVGLCVEVGAFLDADVEWSGLVVSLYRLAVVPLIELNVGEA